MVQVGSFFRRLNAQGRGEMLTRMEEVEKEVGLKVDRSLLHGFLEQKASKSELHTLIKPTVNNQVREQFKMLHLNEGLMFILRNLVADLVTCIFITSSPVQ